MTMWVQKMAESTSDSDLVNKGIVRAWLVWGFFWALFAPVVGILLSLVFNFPTFLDTEFSHFGRLRPLHVNGVILGVFSNLFIGMAHYMVPKLTGTRLYREAWSRSSLILWNGTLVIAFTLLLLGYNKGLEVAELPNPLPLFLTAALGLFAYQVFMTIARRREEKIFVSLWYIIAALVWTMMTLLFGNFVVPYAGPGINNVALHGLYIHYVVGLWITPAGLSVIYFFLPAAARSPLYSHKLSLIGFWSLSFFYPFVGIHHYLYSPIPGWTQTVAIVASMMLIIPVLTVVVNFFGTLKGKWGAFQTDFTVKLMIFGAAMYFIGSVQGSFEALLALQQPTHFTDFVIAHSHATVFGGYVIFVLAACYYVWPRVAGGRFHEATAQWSTWMIMGGIVSMIAILVLQGLIQGTSLMAGAEFVDSLVAMKPYWFLRTLVGTTMDVGIALIGINLYWASRRQPEVQR
ncbi:MAG: cbb3-type cytochrome c oxidase subunit I [Deltaproteobacteria bacterium]|nr:cbb3-type cytochrome c oxidase subunit I [Deltaproteobacteria bacterium]